jgi:hypothetical protein
MEKEIIYWETKNGQKINVDEMSLEHLRNILKMLIKSKFTTKKNTIIGSPFFDEEIEKITKKYKNQAESDLDDWHWKDNFSQGC